MDPITSMFSSVMEKASGVAEVVGDKFMKDVCPDFLKTSTKKSTLLPDLSASFILSEEI